MELEIRPFMGREFCSVMLKNGNYTTELGILNCKDRLTLAGSLLDAVYELIYSDFDSSSDYLEFVENNCH